jgi:DNA polymerase-3 subunit alpha
VRHALSVKSDFSIGQSLLQLDHVIEKAAELGYESVALVDTMSIHGMVDFTNKAKKKGIKPIIGCSINVVEDPTYRPPNAAARKAGEVERPNHGYTLKVYLLNEAGLQSVLALLTKASSAENFYYVPRVSIEDVCACKGIAVSTGDFYSIFSLRDTDRIRQDITKLTDALGHDHVFAELVPIHTPLFDKMNRLAIATHGLAHIPTLVTYPTLYRDDADHETLEVLGTITSQMKMDTVYRPKQYVKDFGFHDTKWLIEKTKASAVRLGQGHLWAKGLRNIETLARLCTFEFKKQPASLPKMADDEYAQLAKLCIEGWKHRFAAPVLGHQPDASELPAYKERLRYELSILKKMGFSGYFLLVEDLVKWAKKNDIIVGPGRGSVGGSLVAYLLGITDVDPIRFNLLFERFINPDRLDLPDADLDFQASKRHLIYDYLSNKYGEDRVAGISNYSTLASASALRDTGRVYGLDNFELSPTKLVPKENGVSATLTEAARLVPEIDRLKAARPEVWNHALKLEGVMRSFGQHAAGVVVAGEPLVNRAVVSSRQEGQRVVSWDKWTVEDWGLVKMDILGLSTLDVLEIAKQLIAERYGKTINYLDLPLEEPDIMDAFGRGDTTGVFQFESPGMKKLLIDLAEGGRLTFEDITAATALYRPGPMDSGLMDDFVNIKKGHRAPHYEHPNMEPALRATNSVIVYQEQVMQIAVDVAGYTKPEADKLRKIMGKKLPAEMAEQRDKWVKGCVEKVGWDAIQAGRLFDKIEAFAGYGFNRSHAVEYSLISHWTMWLRVRYPAEYFAACMSIVDEEKLPGLVSDARKYGVEVLPPDLNRSTHRFTIPDDKTILAPFSAVKGISQNTAQRIVDVRTNLGGKFHSIEAFKTAAAQKGSKINIRVVENLDKVGAFALIDSTQKPPRHPDRRKDQIELLPGLMIDSVKSDRVTDLGDKFLRAKVINLVQEFSKCEACNLKDQPHPAPRCKTNVKFMVVFDCPSWQEEKAMKLLEGDSAAYVKAAMKEAGLAVNEGYYTTLVKAKKDDKFLSNDQINSCAKYLDEELRLIKPSIIVCLGSASVKRFLPGMKKSPSELAGTAHFDPDLDATIVCGINPQQISFEPSKADVLLKTFQQVADILS